MGAQPTERQAEGTAREGPQSTCRFGIIIGHADEAALLRRCIAHHLAIGADHIFVSLNTPNAESLAVVREFETRANVRAAPVGSFAADPFHYFTAAKDVVVDWAAPDWVLFVDTDEFWLPASGLLQRTAALEQMDFYEVPRYNAAPIRNADGSMREFVPGFDTLVIDTRGQEYARPEFLVQHPDVPWIRANDGPKIMIRPEFVEEVGRGAHTIAMRGGAHRSTKAGDLLIVHAPITTEARFWRKVEAIGARMTAYGDRFASGQAWHWRHWLAIREAGGLHAEFERQLFDARDLPALRSAGVLTTPASLFAGGAES
jgi:hypothetical protein